MRESLLKTVSFLKNRGFGIAEVGIILGTGLGKILGKMDIIAEISYNHIPSFPTATVELHQGKFIYGTLYGKKTILMQGRFHFYEGYSMWDITYPVRIMNEFSIKTLIVSNAAGAINLNFKKGELMLLEDHINLQGDSPLAFKKVTQFGKRFVDMKEPYSFRLNNIVEKIAKEKHIPLQKGVYVSVIGPQLETRAEYRMLKILGADAVGMSTVPEIIVANQLQLETIAISVLTDECNPDNLQTTNLKEILKIAENAEPHLMLLIEGLLKSI